MLISNFLFMIEGLIRIRAITAFIHFDAKDFSCNNVVAGAEGYTSNPRENNQVRSKIQKASATLAIVEEALINKGYEVQTRRIATNPFGEYLSSDEEILKTQLVELNSFLHDANIDFFAVGPAKTISEVESCPTIVSSSHRISCSAALRDGNDVIMATKAAECMKKISQLDGSIGDHVKDGLGNFRFCATSCCKAYTPFFPAAMGPSSPMIGHEDAIPFAIGLENGKLAREALQSVSVDKISTTFKRKMEDALLPIQNICESITNSGQSIYVGMDTSLNPSLDENGSVIEAIEQIDIVEKFGGAGSIGAAAEITHALKNLNGIKKVGYCGLMLPVCEDRRLASLASSREIDTTRLLALSSVCGVGLDTVPVPDCETSKLTALILDVAALSHRYEKSLSCRLLIYPGSSEGEETRFNSPYMCECKIFNI